MSLLDVGGVSIFGDELDFLVPVDDSPQEQFKLLSFDDNMSSGSFLDETDNSSSHSNSNVASVSPLRQAPLTQSGEYRKRAAQAAIAKTYSEENKEMIEKELSSWLGLGLELDPSTGQSSLMHPNLAALSGIPPSSSSPNPRNKKKVRTAWGEKDETGHQIEEAFSPSDEDAKQSPNNTSPTNPSGIRAPVPRGSYGIDPGSIEASAYADNGRYGSMQSSSNPSVSSPYAPNTPQTPSGQTNNSWFQSVPLKGEQQTHVPPRGNTYPANTPRRKSIPGTRPTGTTGYGNQGYYRNSDSKLELDANYAKVQLLEMGYPVQKKDPKAFCNQVVNFICTYSRTFVGGFYLNNNQSQNPAVSWILTCTYPNPTEFNQYFHYNVGGRFIMQAATEKRCFCVHSSSWENNSGLLSFLFVPIPNEGSQGNALAVMVLGAILSREEELHTHLLFLDQIRRPIASTLRTLLHIQHNLFMLQKLEAIQYDAETKASNVYEKAVIAVVGALKIDVEEYAIICTNVKGLVTFYSPAAQRLLGYTADELIGKHSLIQLHDLMELNERSKELERELGRPIPADFNVLIQTTLLNRGADYTRIWHWIRKDRSFVPVQITVKPLNDESSVFGFAAIAKEVQIPENLRIDESRK